MKVTSMYLGYLLEKKKIQKLETQAQEFKEQIRDIKAGLQKLERSKTSVSLENTSNLNRLGAKSAGLEAQPAEKEQRQPWGDYIFLILITSLLMVTGFML